MIKTTTLLISASLFLGACFSPWWDILKGMRSDQITTEMSQPGDDYNSKAPPQIKPSQKNSWILFIYNPTKTPSTHEAFLDLDKDCFFMQLPDEFAEPETPGGPQPMKHAAICAAERVPKPPPEE